ncbi:hypothetical protein ABEV34_19765 [Methylorubrum rhodesianum]|uniref:hypothetical protein n=1 Tax=Methylorubrum rhodesianum TaxID=29427 RepID=UPI003D2DF7EE
MSRRDPRTAAGERGTADRVEAGDGRYFVRLVTRQALDREGAAMRSCLGDGSYDGEVGSESLGDDAIWSLRRATDGVSIATLQVAVWDAKRAAVTEARGYRNRPTGRGASQACRHLVDTYAAAGLKLRFSSSVDVILARDGRTYRTDRVPEHVLPEAGEEPPPPQLVPAMDLAAVLTHLFTDIGATARTMFATIAQAHSAPDGGRAA